MRPSVPPSRLHLPAPFLHRHDALLTPVFSLVHHFGTFSVFPAASYVHWLFSRVLTLPVRPTPVIQLPSTVGVTLSPFRCPRFCPLPFLPLLWFIPPIFTPSVLCSRDSPFVFNGVSRCFYCLAFSLCLARSCALLPALSRFCPLLFSFLKCLVSVFASCDWFLSVLVLSSSCGLFYFCFELSLLVRFVISALFPSSVSLLGAAVALPSARLYSPACIESGFHFSLHVF